MRQDSCIDALNFRHACKIFDEEKKIPKEDFEYILEAGRLSPSSFGMEHWRFLVITNYDLKKRLRPFCWNQPQITTCSHLLVIKAIKDLLRPESKYIKDMFLRRDLPKEKFEKYLTIYKEFMQDKLEDEKLFCWSAKQCYIAAANMMSAAAFIKVDSCAIEGYEKDRVEEILNIDKKNEEIALMITFGYRVKSAPKKVRLDLKKIVEWIK